MGEHRIDCGDSREREFLKRLIGEGAAIDAAFMDPPYNVKINICVWNKSNAGMGSLYRSKHAMAFMPA